MCELVSTSFFFVAIMAVADGIAQFLTRANLLLNLIHTEIQDDPAGNFRDEFQGPDHCAENQRREIRPSSELTGWHALSVIISNFVLLTL